MYYIRSRSVEYSDDSDLTFSDLVASVQNMPAWYTPDMASGIELVNGELVFNQEKKDILEGNFKVEKLPKLTGTMFVDAIRYCFANASMLDRINANKFAIVVLDVLGRTTAINQQIIDDTITALRAEMSYLTPEQLDVYQGQILDWLFENDGINFVIA